MPNVSWLSLTNTILARVRDPGALQHSLALSQDLLTRLQWLYNTQGHFALQTYSLPVQPHLPFYSLTEATGDAPSGPQGIIILKVTHNNRPLDRLTLSQLTAIDPFYLRTSGPRLEGFVQLGWNLLFLWPLLGEASTATVTSTLLTPSLLGNADLLSIPLEATPRLGQLLELLLLLRQRDTIPFTTLMSTFTGESHASS